VLGENSHSRIRSRWFAAVGALLSKRFRTSVERTMPEMSDAGAPALPGSTRMVVKLNWTESRRKGM